MISFFYVLPRIRKKVVHYCNQSLKHGSSCRSCRDRLSRLEEAYFRGPDIGNVSNCTGYPFICAAALVNPFGPTDLRTTQGLFLLDFSSGPKATKRHKNVVFWGCDGQFCWVIGDGCWGLGIVEAAQ
ncbi:putative LRR receptor-like serine/threonine-protein kinase RKF3 [Vitis vinifera]|uniref:Putative LRR receptor-like serine/threonine-protein kinase RKF3 n=1 Tax=Vitis vinifera TaxID=29760 RepID=A0A438KC43_VITVI|nr:putative LRR receptor-like serine/threonine-protein kinase RKF3 [Vitis vinifera]